jgi:hypothetical protein
MADDDSMTGGIRVRVSAYVLLRSKYRRCVRGSEKSRYPRGQGVRRRVREEGRRRRKKEEGRRKERKGTGTTLPWIGSDSGRAWIWRRRVGSGTCGVGRDGGGGGDAQ